MGVEVRMREQSILVTAFDRFYKFTTFNLFIVLILSLVGEDYSVVRARLAHPVAAILMGLFTVSVLYHMKLGMQVVIEDYIPREGFRIFFLVLNILFCFILGGITIFALLKIALGS